MKPRMLWIAILILVVLVAVAVRMRKILLPAMLPTSWLWPVKGHSTVSSPFGSRTAPTAGASTDHNGIDIPAPVGTPVQAPWNGTVRQVYWNSAGGNQLIIDHDDGRVSGYAHLDTTAVVAGQKVSRGETIATVGSTGHVTGPHLHFTARPSKSAPHIDPLDLYA
ncbi:MAG TPA: M23 family metallopeptidase [Flavobacteriales bacterium]|nr:M23 family metallopeptidase [Flavobacteriales bacterium]